MKRYLIAAGVGSLVFAAAVGSASVLDLDPGVAQTGIEELGGDENGVKVETYKVESNTGVSNGARVAGINDVPTGSEMYAVIFDASGNELAEDSSVYDGSGKVNFSWTEDVADIEQIRVTFESGDA